MLDKVYKWWHKKVDEMDDYDNDFDNGIKLIGLGMINGALTCMTVLGTVVYINGILTAIGKRK